MQCNSNDGDQILFNYKITCLSTMTMRMSKHSNGDSNEYNKETYLPITINVMCMPCSSDSLNDRSCIEF